MNATNATDSNEITLSARLAVLFDMIRIWLPRRDTDGWELEADIRDLAFDIDRGEKVPDDLQPLVSEMSAWMREHCPLDLQEVQIDLAYISNDRPTAYVVSTERVSGGDEVDDPASMDAARDAVAQGLPISQTFIIRMHYAEAQAHDAGLDWDFSGKDSTQAEAWYEDTDGDLLHLLDEEEIDIQLPGDWDPLYPQRRGDPMEQILEARERYGRVACEAAKRSDCRGWELDRIADWMETAYRGEWASIEEYIQSYIEETGVIAQILEAKISGSWPANQPVVPQALQKFLTFDYAALADEWDHLQLVSVGDRHFVFDLGAEI